MKVAILQPGYLPWLGFFDLMYRVDTFVVLDDVQYTLRDWRNRNRIKTPHGVLWLTVPVQSKGARETLVRDVKVDNTQPWQKKHLRSLESFYRKAVHFEEIIELVDSLYKKNYAFLIDVDRDFMMKVHSYLSFTSTLVFSSDVRSSGKKDEKLLSLCKQFEATHYLSGNAAKAYLRETIFSEEGIAVEWHDYVHPFYRQLWLKEQGFITHLSVIDLLFNHGPESLNILTCKTEIAVPEGVRVACADDV